MSQNKNNPYSQAAGAYGQQAKSTDDQRELEAQALIKAATEMQRLMENWEEVTPEDLDNVISYNRKLWMLFFDAAAENQDDRPVALRNNIINLCNFIFKRGIDILADPAAEKFAVMIDINREIAAGLRQAAQADAEAGSKPSGDPLDVDGRGRDGSGAPVKDDASSTEDNGGGTSTEA